MVRPLTFSQVRYGTRVNHETNVEIRTCRDNGGQYYVVAIPAQRSTTGEVRAYAGSFARAHRMATNAAQQIRAEIAAAHTEAFDESTA